MEWINSFREEIATVIAALKYNNALQTQDYNGEPLIVSGEKARVRLLTRLNMNVLKSGNEYNGVLSDILTSIDFSDKSQVSEHDISTIIVLSRKILEVEWKRVKNEAGGKEK